MANFENGIQAEVVDKKSGLGWILGGVGALAALAAGGFALFKKLGKKKEEDDEYFYCAPLDDIEPNNKTE